MFSRQRINDGVVDPLKIAGCVTPARSEFSLVSRWLQKKTSETGRAKYQPAAASLRAAPECPEDSEESSSQLNSRRKLRRAFSTLRFVPRRQIGGRIDRGSSPQRRGRNNISPGAVARRENRSCRDGESVRNGTARPGPAYPTGGSKRKEAERRSADSRGALSDGTIDIAVEGDNSGRRRRRREPHIRAR